MTEAFRPPVRFPRLLAKVNAFLLIALLLVATFVGIVAHKQGWFVQQTMIRIITPDALGISNGMPVKLFGFTVGSVREMHLVPGGVDVQLTIMSQHMPRIPKGSRARFARESGVIGASVIEISVAPRIEREVTRVTPGTTPTASSIGRVIANTTCRAPSAEPCTTIVMRGNCSSG